GIDQWRTALVTDLSTPCLLERQETKHGVGLVGLKPEGAGSDWPKVELLRRADLQHCLRIFGRSDGQRAMRHGADEGGQRLLQLEGDRVIVDFLDTFENVGKLGV